jgi:TM2 domain-containing membrane protein YozV
VNPVVLLKQPKSRKVATILAFAGTVAPIAGIHKFYLGQPLWGILYLMLSWTPIPRIASAIEGAWYLSQDGADFDQKFNNGITAAIPIAKPTVNPENISAIVDAVRHLDQLRTDGLISEYEFEQKRRQLLDRIS